jgi:hypothetical protein
LSPKTFANNAAQHERLHKEARKCLVSNKSRGRRSKLVKQAKEIPKLVVGKGV